jgi:hypothetical protein
VRFRGHKEGLVGWRQREKVVVGAQEMVKSSFPSAKLLSVAACVYDYTQ